MVHTMNELIVLFQRWGGSADDDINIFVGPTHSHFVASYHDALKLMADTRH